MHHLEHLDPKMAECITNCSDCHDTCEETAVYAVQRGIGAEHVRLLLDCAGICDTSRDFMLRGSPLHTQTCGICADVCMQCAEMCETHNDEMMRRCAEMCRRCSATCREMARHGGGEQRVAA
jgi:hypothetical protein